MNRYSKISLRKIPKGPLYYSNVIYPKIPLSNTDIYVMTTRGDRFDTLANQFYGDKSLWWVISSANQSLPQNSLFIPQGTQIRIRVNFDAAVRAFNNQTF